MATKVTFVTGTAEMKNRGEHKNVQSGPVTLVDGKCTCCPYGYHIDLDFLNFCKNLTDSSTLSNLKRIQRTKRKLRKSMEVMLHQQQHGDSATATLAPTPPPDVVHSTEASRLINMVQFEQSATQRVLRHIDSSVDATISTINSMHFEKLQPVRDQRHFSSDSEDGSGYSPVSPLSNTPRFATFPSSHHPHRHGSSPYHHSNTGDESSHFATSLSTSGRTDSLSSLSSSISTSSSDQVLGTQYTSHASGMLNSQPQETATAQVHKGVTPHCTATAMTSETLAATMAAHFTQQDQEINESSSANMSPMATMSKASLAAIRESLAISLQRMRDLEDQVKAIPVLQVRISVLKEEKRLLALQLKAKSSSSTVRSIGVGEDSIDAIEPIVTPLISARTFNFSGMNDQFPTHILSPGLKTPPPTLPKPTRLTSTGSGEGNVLESYLLQPDLPTGYTINDNQVKMEIQPIIHEEKLSWHHTSVEQQIGSINLVDHSLQSNAGDQNSEPHFQTPVQTHFTINQIQRNSPRPLTRSIGVGEGNVHDSTLQVHEKELRTVIIGNNNPTVGKRNVGVDVRVATRSVGVSYSCDDAKPSTRTIGVNVTCDTSGILTSLDFKGEAELRTALRDVLQRSVHSVGISCNFSPPTSVISTQTQNVAAVSVGSGDDCRVDVDIRQPVIQRSFGSTARPETANCMVSTEKDWMQEQGTNTVGVEMYTKGCNTENKRVGSVATNTEAKMQHSFMSQTEVEVFQGMQQIKNISTNTVAILTANTGSNTAPTQTKTTGVNTKSPNLVVENFDFEICFEDKTVNTTPELFDRGMNTATLHEFLQDYKPAIKGVDAGVGDDTVDGVFISQTPVTKRPLSMQEQIIQRGASQASAFLGSTSSSGSRSPTSPIGYSTNTESGFISQSPTSPVGHIMHTESSFTSRSPANSIGHSTNTESGFTSRSPANSIGHSTNTESGFTSRSPANSIGHSTNTESGFTSRSPANSIGHSTNTESGFSRTVTETTVITSLVPRQSTANNVDGLLSASDRLETNTSFRSDTKDLEGSDLDRSAGKWSSTSSTTRQVDFPLNKSEKDVFATSTKEQLESTKSILGQNVLSSYSTRGLKESVSTGSLHSYKREILPTSGNKSSNIAEVTTTSLGRTEGIGDAGSGYFERFGFTKKSGLSGTSQIIDSLSATQSTNSSISPPSASTQLHLNVQEGGANLNLTPLIESHIQLGQASISPSHASESRHEPGLSDVAKGSNTTQSTKSSITVQSGSGSSEVVVQKGVASLLSSVMESEVQSGQAILSRANKLSLDRPQPLYAVTVQQRASGGKQTVTEAVIKRPSLGSKFATNRNSDGNIGAFSEHLTKEVQGAFSGRRVGSVEDFMPDDMRRLMNIETVGSSSSSSMTSLQLAGDIGERKSDTVITQSMKTVTTKRMSKGGTTTVSITKTISNPDGSVTTTSSSSLEGEGRKEKFEGHSFGKLSYGQLDLSKIGTKDNTSENTSEVEPESLALGSVKDSGYCEVSMMNKESDFISSEKDIQGNFGSLERRQLKSIMKQSKSDSANHKKGIRFAESVIGGTGSSSEETESSESDSESTTSFEEGSYDGQQGDITYQCRDDEAIAQGLPGAKMYDQNIRETSIPAKQIKGRYELSQEMRQSCDMLANYLVDSTTIQTKQLNAGLAVVQAEWFRVSSHKLSSAHQVEDYLSSINEISHRLLEYIVNMVDNNGNAAIHYSVSHGNFEIVGLLLDTEVCDVKRPNKAGYTPVMLAALVYVQSDEHRNVIRRLFAAGDFDARAAQTGQTALMLAVSHGRADMVHLLLEVGANCNIQDFDGSTALMCACEHGHKAIVQMLLSQPGCDANITDNEHSTALSVAMEAGNKDIGVILYKHLNFSKPATSSAHLDVSPRTGSSFASTSSFKRRRGDGSVKTSLSHESFYQSHS